MTGNSRTENTARNIGAGIINRIVSILLPFINRTAILWILGAEFTGLSGLFSSILTVLNIAELGFNTAIVYSLYRPMAEHDEKKICELVSLFKKIYDIIGTLVLGAGICVMPFLKYLIHGSYPESINLYWLYFLYLLNSSVSYYLFAYKECLLIADQRQDIANNLRTVVSIFRYIVQFFLLLITKNFYIYLITAIIGTIATNLAIQYETCKRYPYYHKLQNRLIIPSDILTQVKGLMINRICDTFRNSFDNLIISGFLGLTATAIYGNYYYIYSSLYGIMLVICNAMGASIGNSIIKKTAAQNYHDMLVFSHIFAWILGWCTVCLVCIYQPFMELWAGNSLLLSTTDMLLFCVYFYVINMNNIRNQYISGTGMWWHLRYSYIVEALANLLLNFCLGKILGITGVILATIITIFIFNYLQRNIVLFKTYFSNQSLKLFLAEQFYYAAITMIASGMTYLLCIKIHSSGLTNLLFRGIICLIFPNLILGIGFILSPRINETKVFLRHFASKILYKHL